MKGGGFLCAIGACLLSSCLATAPPTPFAIKANDAKVRAAILNELRRDEWILISETPGTIFAMRREQAHDPPKIRVEYDQSHVAFRYAGGLKSMPVDNGHEMPLHASAGMPGSPVLASYDESSEDDYADDVVELCKDMQKYLREQSYDLNVSIVSDAVAIPLTGRLRSTVVRSAVLQALNDEEWRIDSDRPGVILIRQFRDGDEDVRMRVAYGESTVILSYLGIL